MRVELSTMSVFIVVITVEDVCCSLVFGTLVGVSVFTIIWSELLTISHILCGHQCTSARVWSVRSHLR